MYLLIKREICVISQVKQTVHCSLYLPIWHRQQQLEGRIYQNVLNSTYWRIWIKSWYRARNKLNENTSKIICETISKNNSMSPGAARRTNEYVVYIFCGLIVESHIDPFAVMIYYRYSKSMKNKVFL